MGQREPRKQGLPPGTGERLTGFVDFASFQHRAAVCCASPPAVAGHAGIDQRPRGPREKLSRAPAVSAVSVMLAGNVVCSGHVTCCAPLGEVFWGDTSNPAVCWASHCSSRVSAGACDPLSSHPRKGSVIRPSAPSVPAPVTAAASGGHASASPGAPGRARGPEPSRCFITDSQLGGPLFRSSGVGVQSRVTLG